MACLEALRALTHAGESAPPAQTDGPSEVGEISNPHQRFKISRAFPLCCYFCCFGFSQQIPSLTSNVEGGRVSGSIHNA